MHHRTAWTKASTLPSDRIPPVSKQHAPGGNASKSKRKQREVPKSKEVKRLEQLRDGLKNTQSVLKDPEGGCVCLARRHDLSPYTPICRHCGLILCALNSPQYACPHCTSPLMTPPARETLIASLDVQIVDILAKEEAARQQAVEDARKAAGAFPALGASASVNSLSAGPGGPLETHPVNQTHTVLSLNSKAGKIRMEKRTAVPPTRPSSSLTPSSSDTEGLISEKVPQKVPPPLPEVLVQPYIHGEERPWARQENLRLLYVPPQRQAQQPQSSTSKGKGKKKQETHREGNHGAGGSSRGGAENKPV